MDTQKFCKYELMTSKELVNECKRRGLKPYLGGKKWNHSHVMRCKLRDDDAAKKKAIPSLECPNISRISQEDLKS